MAHIGEDNVLFYSDSRVTWIYDTSDDTWNYMNPTLTPDRGLVAYIGSDQAIMKNDNGTYLYDLSEDAWVSMGASNSPIMPSAEEYCRMTYIAEDKVILFGIQNDSTYEYNETWIYDLSENTWSKMNPGFHPPYRVNYDMAYMGGDKVLLFGGGWSSPYYNDTWIYDLSDDIWVLDSNSLQPSKRYYHALGETRMDRASYPVLFGGNDGHPMDETWLFGDGEYPMQDYPQVNVSFPNGGETVDGSVEINWTATDADSGETSLLVIDLDYSSNSGESWAAIDSNKANIGLYTWNISGIPDGFNYLIRITATDTAGLSNSDSSDAVFRIYKPDSPLVDVINPNGGETFDASTTITWVATDPDIGETGLLMIDMEYSSNAGTSWAAIDSNQYNDGSYYWNTSSLSDSYSYLLRITATDTTGFLNEDSSDSFFTIYHPDSPGVTVLYPNGGEILDSSTTIAWSATDSDIGETELLLVDLHYRDTGGSWVAIDSNQVNNGSYEWDITELPDGFNYQIMITAVDTTGRDATDYSDTYFRIYHPDSPVVDLSHPLGGEALGVSTNITWVASDADIGETSLLLVDLEYSPDDGVNWQTISQNHTNSGSYLWDLYEVESGTEYLVRITVTDTVGLFDTDSSDSTFTIRDPSPTINSIEDVPEDQGRQVAVLWDRSYLDAYQYQMITEYSIWREFTSGQKELEEGREWYGGRLEDFDLLLYRVIEFENEKGDQNKSYWEFIGSVIANYLEGYSYFAPTLYDSLSGDPAYFSFIVTAHTEDPFLHWTSAPDSGYSIDNIIPAKTQVSLFTMEGTKSNNNTIWLIWSEVTKGTDGSPEHGPSRYNVYFDNHPDFIPNPANVLVTTYDLSLFHTDARIGDPAVNLYYLVTVLDESDNESEESIRVGEFDQVLINGE
ncbi:Ser-Thr-rich GPI-anchored membrane family protein [Candidatus Zixiibacteriota bacterium]